MIRVVGMILIGNYATQVLYLLAVNYTIRAVRLIQI
jgi:hypothetical protein